MTNEERNKMLGQVYLMQEEDDLEHSGILGMKWGVRRWQNEDGSLTEERKQRYSKKYSKWSPDYAGYAGRQVDKNTKGAAIAGAGLGTLLGAAGAAMISPVLLPVAAIGTSVISAGIAHISHKNYYDRVYETEALKQLARSGENYLYKRL